MFIVENGTERQVVNSLDGLGPEWSIVDETDTKPPSEGVWNSAKKQWDVDQARLVEREELAEVTDRAKLRRALQIARQRILAIENRQTQLIAAMQELQARVTTLEGG